jgi:AcrR family transcriptional regulator
MNVNMPQAKNRSYVSPTRERQATATRNRILDAAEDLLLKKGFAGMTVAAVAAQAGVSPQSVYSIFTSKTGIIAAAIENRMLRDERNIDALKQLRAKGDPILILQSVAQITRSVYEGNAPTFNAIHGAGLVSPQLARLENELDQIRWSKQEATSRMLCESGKLLARLNAETVRDILWALTSRELYRLFVFRRGWSPAHYEKQVYAMLVAALVRPDVIETHREAGTLHLPE